MLSPRRLSREPVVFYGVPGGLGSKSNGIQISDPIAQLAARRERTGIIPHDTLMLFLGHLEDTEMPGIAYPRLCQ